MYYLASSNKVYQLQLKEMFSYWVQIHNLIDNLEVSILNFKYYYA